MHPISADIDTISAYIEKLGLTFWVVKQPLVRADKATIPHLKENSQTFHMTPIV